MGETREVLPAESVGVSQLLGHVPELSPSLRLWFSVSSYMHANTIRHVLKIDLPVATRIVCERGQGLAIDARSPEAHTRTSLCYDVTAAVIAAIVEQWNKRTRLHR